MVTESLEQLHPEGLSELQERLALRLYELGAVQFNFEEPWVLASGEASHVYINGRLIQSDEEAKKYTIDQMVSIAHPLEYDRVAGVPTEAIPLASTFFDRTRKPQITPRMVAKNHGLGNSIDGIYHENDVILLLEGTTTTGESMIKVTNILRSAGLIVRDAIVVCDRKQGAIELLAQHGINLYSVLDLQKVLPFYQRCNIISHDQLTAIRQELFAN